MTDTAEQKKTAVVAIIGRPSAGKSTFLNTVCGQKVSIVAPTPQTTRNAVRGIVNTPRGQLVFIDTPGYHLSDKKLNLRLKAVAEEQLESADAVLYLIDSTRPAGPEETAVAELAASFAQKTVAAVNKCDLAEAEPERARAFVRLSFPLLPDARLLSISAQNGDNTDAVLDALYELAPYGAPYYPEEYYTDQEVEFRIAEIIREQTINRLRDELPHAVYVQIADMQRKPDSTKLWVRAFLCVEKESQKGMVIGKGAALIKEIRVESIKTLRKIFPYRVELDLQVKVDKNWRQRDSLLHKLIT